MKRLKRELDNNSWNNNIVIKRVNNNNRKNMMNMVTLINNDFNINITDPLISNSIPIINIPKKLSLCKNI